MRAGDVLIAVGSTKTALLSGPGTASSWSDEACRVSFDEPAVQRSFGLLNLAR